MEFEELMESRRAVNFFNQEKDLPEGTLEKIIEIAAKTPSSFNLQPWSLMVLRDSEDKLRLQKVSMNQAKISEAPVTLIVLADRDAWKAEHPFVEKTFQENIRAGGATEEKREWFINTLAKLYGKHSETMQGFACKNTGFFTMSLMLAAKSLGVDSHPMDGFDHDGVRKEFNIPENYWVPLLLALGYFDDTNELTPPKWRKSYNEIVVNF